MPIKSTIMKRRQPESEKISEKKEKRIVENLLILKTNLWLPGGKGGGGRDKLGVSN